MSAYYSNTPEGNDSSNNGSHNNSPFSNPTTKWIIGGVLVATLTLGGIIVLGNQLNSNNNKTSASNSTSLKSLVTTSSKSNTSSSTSVASSTTSTSASVASIAPTESTSVASSITSSTSTASSVANLVQEGKYPIAPSGNKKQFVDVETGFNFIYDSSKYEVSVRDFLNCDAACKPTPASTGRVVNVRKPGTKSTDMNLNIFMVQNTAIDTTYYTSCLPSNNLLKIDGDWYRIKENDSSRTYVKSNSVIFLGGNNDSCAYPENSAAVEFARAQNLPIPVNQLESKIKYNYKGVALRYSISVFNLNFEERGYFDEVVSGLSL